MERTGTGRIWTLVLAWGTIRGSAMSSKIEQYVGIADLLPLTPSVGRKWFFTHRTCDFAIAQLVPSPVNVPPTSGDSL
jgi:hypothetical protein